MTGWWVLSSSPTVSTIQSPGGSRSRSMPMPRGRRPSTPTTSRDCADQTHSAPPQIDRSSSLIVELHAQKFSLNSPPPPSSRDRNRLEQPHWFDLGSAINLHQLFDPFLTRNFHIAAATTARAMARACREPIRARRTVARNPCRTRRNCRGAQRSAWCLRVAGRTGCRPLVVRERPVIGKAATARTIVLVFRHASSPGRRPSADFRKTVRWPQPSAASGSSARLATGA
jgi:hypothetical protein